jgi:hypothetical protein
MIFCRATFAMGDLWLLHCFLFSPDWHIQAAYPNSNSPGNTHDSTMATMSRIYNLINEVFYSTEGTTKSSGLWVYNRGSPFIKSFANNARCDR